MRSTYVNNANASPGAGGWLPHALSELSSLGEDVVESALGGGAFQPRVMCGIAARLGLLSAETLASFFPGQQAYSLRELANKLGAWYLFSYADRLVGGFPSYTLTEIGDQVARLDRFTAVWVAEGLGYFYTQNALSRSRCRRLFQNEEAERLSMQMIIPLHTGCGLALAEAALQGADAAHLQNRLQDFWHLCVENARESYAEMTFESLGLVAITLFPQLVSPIEQELMLSAAHLGGYFWHGVGRGLYFSPSTFVPVRTTRSAALEMSQRLSMTGEGRRNALAGFAWALTLVNIRHARVIELCLRDHEREILDLDAFSKGMASATKLWSLVAPQDPDLEFLRNFLHPANGWNLLEKGFEGPQSLHEAPCTLFHVSADKPGGTC